MFHVSTKEQTCIDNDESLYKERMGFLLVCILIFPTMIGIYFYARPNIEKVYYVHFDSTFDIGPFDMSLYDYEANATIGYTYILNSTTPFDSQIYLESLELSFAVFDESYRIQDYMRAKFGSGTSDYWFTWIVSQDLFTSRQFSLMHITSFSELQTTMFQFKMSQKFWLAFIRINMIINTSIAPQQISYYHFYNTGSKNQAQPLQEEITIYSLTHNTSKALNYNAGNVLEYPYLFNTKSITTEFSLAVWDMSFR